MRCGAVFEAAAAASRRGPSAVGPSGPGTDHAAGRSGTAFSSRDKGGDEGGKQSGEKHGAGAGGEGGWACPRCGFDPPRLDGFPAFAPELAGGAGGFDAARFAELARLESDNFWFRSRNRLIIWALERYFPGAKSFLEVGCGTGYVISGVTAALPGLAATGSEAGLSGLAFAARRAPRAAFLQMDARRIPYEGEFDVAGAFDVIEHIDDDVAVLLALARAVRRGGGLLLTVPQHPTLWSAFDACAGHVRRYTAGELAGKVRQAGLEIVRMSSFVTLLLPFMYLSRLARRKADPAHDPLAEFALPRAVNRAFERVLDCERWLIRAGASLPAGGSLLLVARRRDA
ncbi:MAG: class I SAM-dependent methyltransferase [Burkholderiales bacterium]|nr:class I SAM-dependent methyltransferase [Burkholderiales bacterium]